MRRRTVSLEAALDMFAPFFIGCKDSTYFIYIGMYSDIFLRNLFLMIFGKIILVIKRKCLSLHPANEIRRMVGEVVKSSEKKVFKKNKKFFGS